MDRSRFEKLEEQVLLWMGNVNLTAEIFYLPLFMVTLTSRVLFIHTYSILFPIIRSTALWRTLNPIMTLQCEPAGDRPSLPLELHTRVRQMVGSLQTHSLKTTLGAREEIWSVGRMAKQGEQLEGWGPARTR